MEFTKFNYKLIFREFCPGAISTKLDGSLLGSGKAFDSQDYEKDFKIPRKKDIKL